MKKLVFGLISTILLAFNGIAQENSKNNYDYVGRLHNEILSELVTKNDVAKMSLPEIEAKVKTIALANKNYMERFKDAPYVSLSENDIQKGMADYPNKFANIVNKSNVSSEAKEKLNELIGYCLDNGEKMSSKELFGYIISFEDTVMKSDLKEEEKGLILSATSVARYSNQFWTVQQTVENSTSRFWHWFGDLLGGVAGGIAGSFIEPGVGTYAGAIIGAGVVSGSIKAIESSK